MTGPQDPAAEAATAVELLRARARLEPDKSAYTFLVDGEREGDHLTFGELDRRAQAVGALLQERGAAGERVLLLYPSGLDFLAGFFGCMYAGAVAVPAPIGEPGQLQRTLPRLQAVARDAEPTLVLTTSAGQALLAELFRLAPELADLPVLATDALEPGLEDRWKDPEAQPDDLCFLQYTSGSTSSPKGVMVSHANLLYTAKDIDAGWKYTADSVVVTWLPIFHDMGLIVGIVLPAYKGFHCYVMTPVAFIQKPARWLAAMSRYKGTHSAGPNFAYDLCARKISPDERAGFDLSSWIVTLDSAEPVRRETMERFVDAFGPCGFRMNTFCPGFGLAESTVKTTASNVGEPPTFLNVRRSDLEQHRLVPVDPEARGPGVVSLVGNGAPILDTRVVIADPERRTRLEANQIGEIWVAGPCVAQGYWKKPEDTEHTFRAHLADGDGPYMRTGDLGFLDEDGVLFCTGRIKDLIIVRGRNLYPQDVELAAEKRHGALRPGCSAAFSVDLAGEERLVIAFEVDPRKNPDPEEVFGAIRQGMAEEYELSPFALVALEPRTVPKTSSGKIQRRAARELFMTLGLAPLAVSVQRETEVVPESAGAFVRKRILGAGEAQ
ncbi:MAG: fatty acyl-AMP ligase, partial [Planctomycetota bacterium]|nr:fatty acyl-AMP ligase [Planctomycetota bacterium]